MIVCLELIKKLQWQTDAHEHSGTVDTKHQLGIVIINYLYD